MAKCDNNHNCFECTHDDCIASLQDISKKERLEIKNRDKRYYDAPKYLKEKPTRAKKSIRFACT